MFSKETQILIYSNSKLLRRTLKDSLRSFCFENIHESRSTNETRALIQARKFDLLFIDHELDDKCIFQTLDQIKLDPIYKNSSVILLTTRNEIELITKALSQGLSNYITKPFSRKILEEKIQETATVDPSNIQPPEPDLNEVNPADLLTKKTFPPETRILIADDMNTMRRLITRACEKLGYKNVTTVKDGTMAWEELTKAETPYELILSDWNMPNCTGIDLLNRIRKSKNLSATPFIFITAERDSDQVQAAQNTGADAFIGKPFNEEILKEKIQFTFERRYGVQYVPK